MTTPTAPACTECATPMPLSWTDAHYPVSISAARGWCYTSATGWLCPAHAPATDRTWP